MLNKKHYQRLRLYWRGSKEHGSASRTDNVDLDLAAAGLIERMTAYRGAEVLFRITHAGEIELSAENQREIVRRQPHHSFAERVAAFQRENKRMTWLNMEFRVEHSAEQWQFVRPDVFSVIATYDEKRFNPCVHEIKVSRADFLADVAMPEKRGGYAKMSEIMYYAVPAGLVDASEVPEECGLLVEHDPGKFEVLKKPMKRPVKITAHNYMRMILKQGEIERSW